MTHLEGARTLLYKEVLRFWKVAFQTVAAPVLTAIMYLLIFGHVLEDRVQVFPGVGYTSFLIPGLVMMSVLQNAFANSSSSLIQSKITGNLVFLLVTPLGHRAWFAAYVGASMLRGLVYIEAVLHGPSRDLHLTYGADNLAAKSPLHRLGDDDDLKGAALLFASEAGKHITGQILAVDGGVSAVHGG